jgi:hypothetical protein
VSRTDSGFNFFCTLGTALAAGIIAGCMFPSGCSAQSREDTDGEPPGCAPGVYPRRVDMELKGVDGTWYPDPIKRCLVASYGAHLIVEEELKIATDQLRLRANRIERLSSTIKDQDAALTLASSRLGELQTELVSLQSSTPNRAEWFAYGAVVGAVVVVVAAFLVGSSAGI